MLGTEPEAKRAPTPRQKQIIALVGQGLKNQEVARRIGTTEHVVKNYLRAIYDELGFSNRVELALWFEARKAEAHGKEKKSTGESMGMNQG